MIMQTHPINCCHDCYHFYEGLEDGKPPVCLYSIVDGRATAITNVDYNVGFPEWCPLKDVN